MRRLIKVLAVTVTALALGGSALAATSNQLRVRPGYQQDGLLVILALGSDIGPPHRPGDPREGRADAIQLIAVDTKTRKATIVDFPRDSVIAGDKVNAHLVYGGPDNMARVLEDYTGIEIDFWALTSFAGLERMINAMGGVDVHIDLPMHDGASNSNFDPGPAHLNGPEALAYARDRKSMPQGDFGRTRHQGNLLRFVHRQVRAQDNSLPTLLRLSGVFARNTVSNIPARQLLPLAMLAMQIKPADVLQVPLGGSTGTSSSGASVVLLAPGDTFERIRDGRVGP